MWRSRGCCTRGPQVLHFAKGVHIIKDNLFPIPPLFRIIHEESGTDWKVGGYTQGWRWRCGGGETRLRCGGPAT